uniref:Receptor expression-enhancing protein n=1 Tax=Ascaris suum TaxID=6253 RepID=F1LGI9_ASCSU
MVSAVISRFVVLTAGTLYPAYRSYKAVRTKDVREYVKWMMYWIVFALFCFVETITDVIVSFWFPFYYELKIIFVFWLLSPWTKGASILYRKWVHPLLTKHEREIDQMLEQAKHESYNQATIDSNETNANK